MIVRPLRLALVPGPVDDSGLVVRIQSDDEAAFTELYLRHARYVARVVYRLMGDDAELDDIVQDTFVDAADGIASVHEPASIRRWLVVIAGALLLIVPALLGMDRYVITEELLGNSAPAGAHWVADRQVVPGLLAYGTALREPVGPIHWAGTEYSPVWNGYMEGAVRSGEAAAAEVLAALG